MNRHLNECELGLFVSVYAVIAINPSLVIYDWLQSLFGDFNYFGDHELRLSQCHESTNLRCSVENETNFFNVTAKD